MRYFTLILCLVVFTSCKTRKIITDTTQVSKQTTTQQESQVHKADNSKTVDNSVRTNETNVQANNQSEDTTTFHADSAVTITKPDGTTKTKFYIGGNVRTTSKRSGTKTISKKDTNRNNIVRTSKTAVDSAGSLKIKAKSDSTHKNKNVTATGSGTEIGKYIGIGLIIAIVGLLIFGIVRYGKNT